MSTAEEVFALLAGASGGAKLDYSQFCRGVRALGVVVTNKQLKEGYEEKVGEGVELEAFKNLYNEMKDSVSPPTDADIALAFEVISGGKPVATKENIKHFWCNVGETFTEEEADKLLKNAPDELDLAAFKTMLGSE